jgi:hypothetical protein
MKLIKARKITSTFIQIDPVVLEQNSKFRRLFLGELAKGNDGDWHVRGTLTAERRTEEGWQSVEGTSIAKLKAGELAKFELRTEHVKHLISGLNVLADAAEDEGITLRSTQLVVGRKEEIVRIVERDHRAVIEQLINHDRGADFWNALSSLKADLATQLADAAIQSKRRDSLATFQTKLEREEWSESEWERFFIENQWILGYGLRYQFLGLLQRQANYGGTNLTGKGAQRGEFLMATEADQRFTVLVEIKKPQTPIFHDRADPGPYRSGVPGFSTEFANAISQVQTNSRKWESEGSRREDDQELLARKGIHTISPRSILIFGHTKQLSTGHKMRAFELFRTHLSGTDIVTFDELLTRATFIVKEASHTTVTPG